MDEYNRSTIIWVNIASIMGQINEFILRSYPRMTAKRKQTGIDQHAG